MDRVPLVPYTMGFWAEGEGFFCWSCGQVTSHSTGTAGDVSTGLGGSVTQALLDGDVLHAWDILGVRQAHLDDNDASGRRNRE